MAYIRRSRVLSNSSRLRSRLIVTLAATLVSGAARASAAQEHALGPAPCAWAEPIRGVDNALDVPATLRALRDNAFSCIAQVISNSPPDSFADFKRLLAAAQPAGISVWPVLIPPSEGATSLPFNIRPFEELTLTTS